MNVSESSISDARIAAAAKLKERLGRNVNQRYRAQAKGSSRLEPRIDPAL